jgi:hypothetical protein
MRPRGPYPILKLSGEQGSAKTKTAKTVRNVVDPHADPIRRPPRSEEDLMIAAAGNWVVSLDNLSYLNEQMSDALCTLATGGAIGKRTLFTDEDESVLVACRPIMINGIDDPGLRSDFLDRSLHVETPEIKKTKRRTEAALDAEFATVWPAILGALLDAVSAAIRNLPTVAAMEEVDWGRMIDFSQWGVAAEPALGLRRGEFMKAYEDNRAGAHQDALEASPVALAIQKYMQGTYLGEGQWQPRGDVELTAAQLLSELKEHAPDTRAKGWPKAPKVLSGVLSRLAPNLRHVGINAVKAREGNGKVWRISCVPAAGPASTQSTHRTQDSGQSTAAQVPPAGRTQSTHRTQENSGYTDGTPYANGTRTHGTQSTQENGGYTSDTPAAEGADPFAPPRGGNPP